MAGIGYTPMDDTPIDDTMIETPTSTATADDHDDSMFYPTR